MRNVDRIYAKENLGKPCKFVCNVSSYHDYDITIWDYGRPVIDIWWNNFQRAQYAKTFVLLAADYFNSKELPGTDSKIVSLIEPGAMLYIDYIPTIELRNFWKIEDINEDIEYIVTELRRLLRIFEAGRYSNMKDNVEKETEDMYTTITESLYKYSHNSKDICLAGKSVADNSVVEVTIGIEKVIYNNPATVVFWKDHTKTVVKCQGEDSYDPQKGFMLCILKKLRGNQGNYNNFIKKWCPEDIFETMSIRNADGVKFTQITITDKEG